MQSMLKIIMFIAGLLGKFIIKKIKWIKKFKKRKIHQEEKHKKKYENMNNNSYKL